MSDKRISLYLNLAGVLAGFIAYGYLLSLNAPWLITISAAIAFAIQIGMTLILYIWNYNNWSG